MQIIPSSGLSDSEIDQMVKDAELNQEEDVKRKQQIEARNQAENLVFAAQKTLSEHKENLSAEVVSDIESKIEATQKALEQDDVEVISQATADLGQAIQQIGAQMYNAPDGPVAEATPDDGAQQPDGSASSDGEDVVEGEFTEAK
jgi:molecular chaperone DnaK